MTRIPTSLTMTMDPSREWHRSFELLLEVGRTPNGITEIDRGRRLRVEGLLLIC